MQCYKMAFFLSLLFCPLLASAAGVAIAGTRVIYNEQSHEADITVKKHQSSRSGTYSELGRRSG